MNEAYDVVVIGAGITGLAISRALVARGVRHTVLEASAQPGGVIRTRDIDGRIVEEGPQRTRLTRVVRRLIDDLGIAAEVVQAPRDLPLYIFARGRLRQVPLSLSRLLRTDLLPPLAKARVLLEPLTRAAQPDESVAHVFTRRFGRAAYEDFLGPLFGGLYASDPADMPARFALMPALRELGVGRSAITTLLRRRGGAAGAAPAISFRAGMRTLTDAMHASVREHVRLNTPVRTIARAQPGYTVVADGMTVHARHVVLTTPAPAAAALLADVAPGAAAALERLRYNPLALVYLDAAPTLRAMGYQVSLREPLATRGVTFNHHLFARENVCTAFLGGSADPGLVNRSDEDLMEIAAREFEQVTGRKAGGFAVARTAVPAWDSTWTALDELTLPEGIHLAANYESRIGIPGRLARAEAVASDMRA